MNPPHRAQLATRIAEVAGYDDAGRAVEYGRHASLYTFELTLVAR